MSFLDKKESVLDIELTQLGKYLLAKGKFKPVYYVFSDDEVLYNVAFVGDDIENDAETQRRIQRDTQRNMALYEHDGVESRISTLNGHDVQKIRGHQWLARVGRRRGDLPANEIYGSDTVVDERMGSDDRNLVRNFIGNSTRGARNIPSWDIELLLDGEITSVNVSSSSPNIGIQRPVLGLEEENVFKLEEMVLDDPAYGITQMDYDNQTGLEKEFIFLDNKKLTIEDDTIIFSVIEENTDYDKENFEYEFYEIEEESPVYEGSPDIVEHLRKLYFSDETEEKQESHVEWFFEILSDHDLAEKYGMDLRGINKHKLKEAFREAIADSLVGEEIEEEDLFEIGDIEEVCED